MFLLLVTGDSRTSSVSMETTLNCEPPTRPSNWHSSVDSIIISSDNSVEKITKGSFTSQQVEGEDVLELEIETDRGESNDIETNLTDILHPPSLHDSRPSGIFEREYQFQPLSPRQSFIFQSVHYRKNEL